MVGTSTHDTSAVPADTTPPTITAAWCFIEAAGANTPTASKCTPSTATDAGTSVTSTEAIPATLGIGLHKIVVNATDSGGNWSATTRVVLVNDTSAPTLTVPSSFTKAAAGPQTPVSSTEYGSASGTDSVSPPVTVSCNVPATLPAAPPKNFACTATDARGNSVSRTFSIEITDKVAPVFDSTVPTSFTAEARGPYTKLIAKNFSVTATDNADTEVTITPNVRYMAVGDRRTVTWTATDNLGNSASIRQSVVMQDTTAPSIFAPQDVSIKSSTSAAASTAHLGNPIVFDWGDPTLEVTDNAPDQFPVGTTTVTWTATDSSSNSASATQTVTVGATETPTSNRILWTFADVQYVGVVGVADVAVLPDDLLVVPGWYDSEVFVLNSTDGSLVRRIVNSHQWYGISVAAMDESPTDKRFVVGDNKKTVHVYDDHEDTAPSTLGSLQLPSTAHRRGVILDSLGDKLVVYQNDRVSTYNATSWSSPMHTISDLDSLYILPDSIETSEHGTAERIYVAPFPEGTHKNIYVYDGTSGNKLDTVTLPNTGSWWIWPRVVVSDDGRSLFIEHTVRDDSKNLTGTIRHYDTETKKTTIIAEPRCCDTYGNPFEYADGKLYVPRHSAARMEFAVYNVAIDAETNAPNNTYLGLVSIPRTETAGSSLYTYPIYTIRHIEDTKFMTEEYLMYNERVVRLIHAVDLSSPTPPPSIPSQASPSSVPHIEIRLVEPALVSTDHVDPDTITLTYDTELDPYIEYAGFYRLSDGWNVTDVRVDGRTITLTYVGDEGATDKEPSIIRFADVRHPVYAETGAGQTSDAWVLPPPPPPPPPPQREPPTE